MTGVDCHVIIIVGASLKKVRKIHWFQQKLYIVDDVEAEVCQECGERYYHATTLDAIDQPSSPGAREPLSGAGSDFLGPGCAPPV